jgi:adenylate cyclase
MPAESFDFDLRYTAKTIMFADVVESVRLMQFDEQRAARRILDFLLGAAAEIVPQHSGTLVERPGDGLLVAFKLPQDAVGCATALHRRARELAAGSPTGAEIRLRVGIHCDDVLTDGQRYYGHGVNIASRLTSVAGPDETVISDAVRQALKRLLARAAKGETLVSAPVRDHLTHGLDGDIEDLGPLSDTDAESRNKGSVRLESLGEVNLKHVQGPVRAYRVGERGPHPVVPAGTGFLHDLRPTVAVLPFSHYSEPAAPIGVGDVISDQIIVALSLDSSVRVISRLSSQAYRGRSDALASIAATLGAGYVLSGRFRGNDSTLHLSVELADAQTGQIEWADTLSASATEALSANSDCIRRIAAGVMNAVVRSELRAARALALPNLKSHTLYLAATTMLHRFSRRDFEYARQMLVALCERAPRHPYPVAWLARWHVFRVVQGWSPDMNRDRQDALSYAQHALDLDPDSAIALTIAGSVHTNMLKDLEGAQALYHRALQANPQ